MTLSAQATSLTGDSPSTTTTWPEWVCPIHRHRLQEREYAFQCPEGDIFEVKDRVPRFVPASNYADPFGAQWKRYRLTQLDSYTREPITAERMRRCLGEELWNSLRGKQILECGCGAGRFTEVLLERGASVTSIDLSEAVDANQENFPQDTCHRIAQADIHALPFDPQKFDVVFCLGVIQHTLSPEAAISDLAQQVRPGGWLVIDHYTYNLSWYLKTAPLFRRVLRRLPAEEGIRWTEKMVATLLPLHKAVRRIRPAQVLLSRISPVLCYYRLYPSLNEELQREWALLDTHDSLTDWNKHFRTRRQIRRQLEKLGFQETWCERGGNGVEARARRPE